MHVYKDHDLNGHFIHGSLADAMVNNSLDRLVDNAISFRERWLTSQSSPDPRRNLNAECGYPDVVSPQQYQSTFERDPIANRIVKWLPKECWQKPPLVYEIEETQDKTEQTPFEQDFAMVGSTLRGNSWLKTDKDSPVWGYLQRAHTLARIGRYAVIVLGLNDGQELSMPVRGVNETGSFPVNAVVQEIKPDEKQSRQGGFVVNCPPAKEARAQEYACNVDAAGLRLMYLRVFPEVQAQITRFEMNSQSPRFGQPVSYLVSFNDAQVDVTGIGLPIAAMEVHWTRVIHIANTEESSEIFAAPAMRQHFNRVLDLQKLYGGSAEMFWKGAFPGISIEGFPQFAGELEFDSDAIRDSVEQYMNGLQRYLAFTNASAKVMAPAVADPSNHIDKQLEAISIGEGMPKRKFMGSEVGKLASTQDDSTSNDRVMEHQNSFVTYGVIGQFIDRLILLRIVREPAPENGYKVEWQDLNATTATDKAAIALQLSNALQLYVSSGAEQFMAFPDYLVRVWAWSEEEAQAVDDAAMQRAQEHAAQAEQDTQLAGTAIGGN